MTDIVNRLREFMKAEFRESGFHPGIGDDDSLVDSQILDSLSILKLVSFMDDEFGILPDPNELEPNQIDSLNRIAKFISGKLADKR